MDIIRLQQYLPFTVLKLIGIWDIFFRHPWTLQQYLPFTVLKQALRLSH